MVFELPICSEDIDQFLIANRNPSHLNSVSAIETNL